MTFPSGPTLGQSDDALFRAMFNDAGIGMALMDLSGIPLQINGALRDMLRMPVAYLREPLMDDPDRPDQDWRSELEQLLVGGCHHYRTERRFQHTDGTEVWGRITVSAVRDEDGDPRFLIGMVEDITEHKAAGEALRAAEAKFRSIFENAVEGIFQTSPDGHYLAANPALARIYGYDTVRDLEQGLTDISSQLYVDPNRRGEFMRALEQHDEVRDFISQVYRKDGSTIWISENCRAVRDPTGTLLYFEGTVEDISDRKRFEDQLVHDALHDALTGLPNRTLLLDRLTHAMQRSARTQQRYAVLMIDCDRFKLINDSLGHMVGDQLLIELSRRVQDCLRASDTLARLGGDEFVVLAEDLDQPGDAAALAGRIRLALAEPFLLDGQELFVSSSIGIALGSGDYHAPADLLRDADTAMYAAKKAGRNAHIVFEPGMHLNAVSQLQVENDLRRALERDELMLHYQPIMDLRSGKLAGFEALLRWQHPTRGLVPPDQFIPIAEETGLINPIGSWVLASACRQLYLWQGRNEAARGLFMSVNLSPVQIRHPDIVEAIAESVSLTGLDPRFVKLEITESGIMENPMAMKGKLAALRAMGFRLAIDDFGTGYSSLAHLHRFPIDTLKVDRSFIAPMLGGGEHLEIVRTIVMLGQTLKMAVVAEGVETAEHAAMLKALGCTYGQGWLWSRPLEATAAEALI